jgi:hypothetical protein
MVLPETTLAIGANETVAPVSPVAVKVKVPDTPAGAAADALQTSISPVTAGSADAPAFDAAIASTGAVTDALASSPAMTTPNFLNNLTFLFHMGYWSTEAT